MNSYSRIGNFRIEATKKVFFIRMDIFFDSLIITKVLKFKFPQQKSFSCKIIQAVLIIF